MKVCYNIEELIQIIPKFIIPDESIDLYLFLKLKKNIKYNLILSKKYIDTLINKFGDFESISLKEEIKKFEFSLRKSSKFKFFRSGKIIYYDDYIPDNMFQCNNCGCIWGGNIKCKCEIE